MCLLNYQLKRHSTESIVKKRRNLRLIREYKFSYWAHLGAIRESGSLLSTRLLRGKPPWRTIIPLDQGGIGMLVRHRERHRTEHVGWLRAAVLGANDGILSTASLVLGVA